MKKDGYNIAIVGATGAVGQEMMEILEERNFPVREIKLLASERSAGKELEYKGNKIKVEKLGENSFENIDIALFSAGSSRSREFAPIAAQSGAVVIDNSSAFRMEEDVPLVIPEINPHAVAGYKNRGIVANPNCTTAVTLMALKPLHDLGNIKRVVASSYQAVSGAGARAIEELRNQTLAWANSEEIHSETFPHQIAFNVLPQIDSFLDNGYTKEEMKMVWETRKIFEDDNIVINPTCVRIPVFYGHSEAVHIETSQRISAHAVRELLGKSDGITVIDERKNGSYPTAVTDAAGADSVFVGRIREDISHPNGLNMWVVSDNVRKGAALNSVQIAEVMIKKYI